MNAPASSVVEPATSSGVNGNTPDGHAPPPAPLVIGKLSDPSTSGPNGLVHGVKSESVVYVPHRVGVASAACAPPLNASLKLVNGNSGVSVNVVVNWPVASLRCTVPGSFK